MTPESWSGASPELGKVVWIEGLTWPRDRGQPQFRQAADQGHASAQTNLGWMYEQGRGVRLDRLEAARWYRLAADQGHADAQRRLDGLR